MKTKEIKNGKYFIKVNNLNIITNDVFPELLHKFDYCYYTKTYIYNAKNKKELKKIIKLLEEYHKDLNFFDLIENENIKKYF